MGCGQSKIHLYPRKNKNKSNGKKSGHGEQLIFKYNIFFWRGDGLENFITYYNENMLLKDIFMVELYLKKHMNKKLENFPASPINFNRLERKCIP